MLLSIGALTRVASKRVTYGLSAFADLVSFVRYGGILQASC
jgi:hypothetical protein